mmetsp:Transcript_11081/g.15874  ORF Transcript_11081/g.15874 Transcript_11081/m.15874 type:complete len:206 (-) Transcript_11081:711-1328(-)
MSLKSTAMKMVDSIMANRRPMQFLAPSEKAKKLWGLAAEIVSACLFSVVYFSDSDSGGGDDVAVASVAALVVVAAVAALVPLSFANLTSSSKSRSTHPPFSHLTHLSGKNSSALSKFRSSLWIVVGLRMNRVSLGMVTLPPQSSVSSVMFLEETRVVKTTGTWIRSDSRIMALQYGRASSSNLFLSLLLVSHVDITRRASSHARS